MNSLILDLLAMSAVASAVLLIVRYTHFFLFREHTMFAHNDWSHKFILSSFAALVGRVSNATSTICSTSRILLDTDDVRTLERLSEFFCSDFLCHDGFCALLDNSRNQQQVAWRWRAGGSVRHHQFNTRFINRRKCDEIELTQTSWMLTVTTPRIFCVYVASTFACDDWMDS